MKAEHKFFVSLDELVPKDHLVRKIDHAIGFSFIYELVDDLYSEDHGRPSVDPVVLIQNALIQCLFCIRSMRQTINKTETNVAYHGSSVMTSPSPSPISQFSVRITCVVSRIPMCPR